jgi:hypothetical protein
MNLILDHILTPRKLALAAVAGSTWIYLRGLVMAVGLG